MFHDDDASLPFAPDCAIEGTGMPRMRHDGLTSCTECGMLTDEMEPTVTVNTLSLYRAQLLCADCRHAFVRAQEIQDVQAASRREPFDHAALERLKQAKPSPASILKGYVNLTTLPMYRDDVS